MRFTRRMTGALCAAALLAACADVPTQQAPETPEPGAPLAVAGTEQAALGELARAVALALNDAGLRSRVKLDMRAVSLPEHKLDFGSYLAGEGRPLLVAMARATGRGTDEVLALVAAVRPLEMYFPVRAHRSVWRGGADMQVAARLEESEVPMGFTLRGAPVAVSRTEAPKRPTLALVPRETNFSALLFRPVTAVNAEDAGGDAVGTMVEPITCELPMYVTEPLDECGYTGPPADDGGTGSPPPTITYPAGIYFDEMVVYDNNEPWTSGSPEIEVHLIGSKRGVTRKVSDPVLGERVMFFPNEVERISFDCAGAKAETALRRFDFNDEGGRHYYQTVLFASQPNFVVTEFVQTTYPAAIYRREVKVEPPFRLRIVERDDGKECPKAERKYTFDAKFEINWRAGSWTDLIQVKGIDGEDIRYLLSGNNDPVAEWDFFSYAALESLSGTWLPRRTDDTEIDDAIVRVTNRGFTSATLPAFVAFSF